MKSKYDRIVVGGGIFGCYSALTFSQRGLKVLLLQADDHLLSRASFVNQARLHIGLHYPRSSLTATEALNSYQSFIAKFPAAIRDFSHIYAISKYNSKTLSEEFIKFTNRLGISYSYQNPEDWFQSDRVALAIEVNEPSFDSSVIRDILYSQILSSKNIDLFLSTSVTSGKVTSKEIEITLNGDTQVKGEGLVLASYANTNGLRASLGLSNLDLKFEITEVLLGKVTNSLKNVGFTVMDGPFWSLMPFGLTKFHSLTSVGFTPLITSNLTPNFRCQERRTDCSPTSLSNCNECGVRPMSANLHMIQQLKMFLNPIFEFEYKKSLFTIKAILKTTEVDDARPTIVFKDSNLNVQTIVAGKVSTLFQLDKELM